MKRRVVVGVIAFIAAVGLWWFYGHGFVEVTVSNAEAGSEISYRLLDQANSHTSLSQTGETTVKKLVRRGSHEVLVEQGGRSFLAVVKVGGFFTSHQVAATLVAQKDRQFVGNNPNLCMNLVDGVLLSSACSDALNRLQVHVPATATQATLVRRSPAPLGGTIEGVVQTSQGNYVLLKARESTEEEGAPHTLYRLSGDGNVSDARALDDLRAGEFYSLGPAGEGFVAFNASGDHVVHYSSIDAPPTTVAAPAAETDSQLYEVSQRGENVALIYSETGIIEDLGFEDQGGEEVHSEVVTEAIERTARAESRIVLLIGSESKSFTVHAPPFKIRFCATDKLCVVSDETLDVYDITGSKLKSLFKLRDVVAAEDSAAGLVVVTTENMYVIDPDAQIGSVVYSLGEYSYCGLEAYAQAALLCVETAKGGRSVLLIDFTLDNDDSIDEKLAELLKLSEVKDVSVYKQFIFISPEAGELVADPRTGGFGYDPNRLQSAAQVIQQKIDELGIDRSVYGIVNTLQ